MKIFQKTIKKTFCGVVAAAIAAATACAFGAGYAKSPLKAYAAEDAKYSIDAGDFALKTDDSVTIDVSYKHGAYLYNKRDTDGDIRLKYKTVSYSSTLSAGAYNGLVRGKSTDIAYAYVPINANHWYVFGNGLATDATRSLYSAGEYTDILYDVSEHAFSVKIGETAPDMAKMFQSAEATTADASNPKRIAWDANNAEAVTEASLTDFSISDENGFYLGIAMGRTQDSRMTYTLTEDFYGYAGKTVTVKYFGSQTDAELRVYGENGKILNAEATKIGDGVFTFVMPNENVRLAVSYAIAPDSVYGTYYNSATGDTYVLGETSYKTAGGVKTDVTFTAYSDGGLKISDGENTTEAAATISKITIGDDVYKKLLNYTVSFVVDGDAIVSYTLSSGDYKVTPPPAPTKDGYVFAGWKNGKGEDFDEDATVTASAIYYASFTEEGGHIDPKEEKKSSGCNSSAAYSVLAVLPLAALCLTIKAKREGER